MNNAIHNTTERPPKKRYRFVLWIGGIVVALLLVFLWQLFGAHPKIVISPQTTFITAPLRANGMPDYAQWLLENERKGVTPENNAAVLLWQALWSGALEKKHYKLICDELGIDPVPSKEESVQSIYETETLQPLVMWLHEQRRLSVDGRVPTAEAISRMVDARWDRILEGDDYEAMLIVDQIVEEAQFRPWPREGIAPLADWARKNQRPLDLFVAASRRPCFYSPQPQSLDDVQLILTEMQFPLLGASREAAQALSTRAMWHLHEGRPDGAWEDISALYRLARLLGNGQTLIEIVVGTAVEGIAHQACQSYLGSGSLTAEQARRAERDLDSLPNWNSTANAINLGERMIYLDTVIHLVDGEYDTFTEDAGIPPRVATALKLVAIDWNFVLSEGNRLYDRAVAAAKLPTHAARHSAFAEMDSELEERLKKMLRPAEIAWALTSRRRRGELITTFVIGLLIPALEKFKIS